MKEPWLHLALTREQRELLRDVAAAEGMTVECWAYHTLLGAATDGRLALPSRSPRRDEGAEAYPTTAQMVTCPHCRIETRAVKTCDNCDRSL